MRVDREALERNCIQHLGHGLRRPLEFQPSLLLDSTGGMRWTSLLRQLQQA